MDLKRFLSIRNLTINSRQQYSLCQFQVSCKFTSATITIWSVMQQKDFLDVKGEALLYTGNSLCSAVCVSGTMALWTCCPRALQGSHPGLNSMALVCQPGQNFYCPDNNLWSPLLCLLHMFQWDWTQDLSGRADQHHWGWSKNNVYGQINL